MRTLSACIKWYIAKLSIVWTSYWANVRYIVRPFGCDLWIDDLMRYWLHTKFNDIVFLAPKIDVRWQMNLCHGICNSNFHEQSSATQPEIRLCNTIHFVQFIHSIQFKRIKRIKRFKSTKVKRERPCACCGNQIYWNFPFLFSGKCYAMADLVIFRCDFYQIRYFTLFLLFFMPELYISINIISFHHFSLNHFFAECALLFVLILLLNVETIWRIA